MKKRFLLLIFPVVTLILELIPASAVLRFANPEGQPWVRTYSYFDLTPFGYANFGPFITAVLTCILIVLLVIYAIKGNRKILNAAKMVLWITIASSLSPMLLGSGFYSILGGFISLSLITALVAVRIFASEN